MDADQKKEVDVEMLHLGERILDSFNFLLCVYLHDNLHCFHYNIISEPLIQLCSTSTNVNSVNIHGCLSDGSYYETGNIMDADNNDNDLIGRKLGQVEFKDTVSGEAKEGMFWIKGKVGKRGSHLVSCGEGFNVWNAKQSIGD